MNDDFASADWEDLCKRLLAYASFVLASYGRESGPAGKTAAQYVHDAVVRVVGGHYAPFVGRTVFVRIAVVINDLIRHDMDR